MNEAEKPALRVAVLTAKCQSHRRCTVVAPEVFGIDANGKAEVLHPQGASRDEIVKAAKSCPYRAISVVEEASGEQLFPPARKPGAS